MTTPKLKIAAECCLLDASAKLINEFKSKLTIANPKYAEAKKYSRWVGKKFPRYLYFYEERKTGFFMPRGFARQALNICHEICGELPQIIDKRRSLAKENFEFKGTLRPYQQEAVSAILLKDFGVLEAGTGSGKTVMALAIIAARQQPAIIIVHTKELLYQWVERVKTFLGIDAGIVGDGSFSTKPVTIAIVNSARKKLDELAPNFGHVLVDECHRVPATLFTDVVNAFDGKYSLGLSATAYRREDSMTRIIYFYMGEPAHRIDTKILQGDGAILKPEIIFRQTEFSYRFRGDYAALMTALTLDKSRNELIAEDVSKASKEKGGTILLVSDRVAHCEELNELLAKKGCHTALLTGRVAADQRASIVEDINKGEISVLISTIQLIGEGFDAKDLSTLFLATPIKFSGRLQQVIGRILRPAEDKRAVVYDYIDHKIGVLKTSALKRQQTYQTLI